ncbi:MAG: hypothetical protein ACSHX7_03395 [Luteolibacter sp.]
MKNITLSADENLIELARKKAREQNTTLNSLFRNWLEEFAQREEASRKADEVIANLSKHLTFVQKYTREELNER